MASLNEMATLYGFQYVGIMSAEPFIYEWKASGDDGFTLLETLVGLVILSIASLAMMQSTVSILRSSERSISVAERSVEGFMQRQSFRDLLQNLVISWDESETARFRGRGDQILSYSTIAMESGSDGIAPFTLSLVKRSAKTVELDVFRNGETSKLAYFEGQSAFFVFLGRDHIWYPEWPPETLPSSGILNDDRFSFMPEWPNAIGLKVISDKESQLMWVEPIERSNIPLFVADDF